MTTNSRETRRGRPRRDVRGDQSAHSKTVASIVGAGFRADIQGLRALAVLSVVAAHAGVAGLAGGFIGVDLFFVLSGFLISGLLVREFEKRSRISLLDFWSRRARRLIPASAMVLMATAFAAFILLPVHWRLSTLTDVIWSSFFAANWHFALTQADYFADTEHVSPLLHFWSLGVEEQFYFVWPLLVAAAGVVAVRLRPRNPVSLRTYVGLASGLVCVVSFSYSVWILQTNQPLAYYGTPSRVWQLSLGALLAAGTPWLTSRVGRFSNLLAAIGFLGFIGSVIVLSGKESGNYPGMAAVIPTLAAAALILAGLDNSRRTFLSPVLEHRVAQWFGDTSYSLYLWHFPILIIGGYYFAPAGWIVTSGLVVVSILLAGITYRYVETPARTSDVLKSKPWYSLGMGLTLIALSAVTALAFTNITKQSVGTFINDVGQSVVVTPDPLKAKEEQAENQIISGCAFGFENGQLQDCSFGAEKSSSKVVLLGDSLARNVLNPLSDAASAEGWEFHAWVKSSCTPANVTLYERIRKIEYTQCDEFREESINRTIAEKPDLVVLVAGVDPAMQVYDRESGTLLSVRDSAPVVLDGWRTTIDRFTRHSIRVVVVPGWARAPHDPVTCLLEIRDARKCAFTFNSEFAESAPARVAADENTQAGVLTLDHHICTAGTCDVVKGSTLVYYDAVHVSRLFAQRFVSDFQEMLSSTK